MYKLTLEEFLKTFHPKYEDDDIQTSILRGLDGLLKLNGGTCVLTFSPIKDRSDFKVLIRDFDANKDMEFRLGVTVIDDV